MNVVVGLSLAAVGIAGIWLAPALARLQRRRDATKGDERRNLDWSQNFDMSIVRFLGVSVLVVGLLILIGVIPLD